MEVLNASESKVAPILNEVVKRYTNVKIGSYPIMENRDYSLMVTLESLDNISLNSAFENLLNSLTRESLIRVED